MLNIRFVLFYFVAVSSLVLNMTLSPRLVKDADLSSSSEGNVEMLNLSSTSSERDRRNSLFTMHTRSDSSETIESFSTNSESYIRHFARLQSDSSDSSQTTEPYYSYSDSSELPKQVVERKLNDDSDSSEATESYFDSDSSDLSKQIVERIPVDDLESLYAIESSFTPPDNSELPKQIVADLLYDNSDSLESSESSSSVSVSPKSTIHVAVRHLSDSSIENATESIGNTSYVNNSFNTTLQEAMSDIEGSANTTVSVTPETSIELTSISSETSAAPGGNQTSSVSGDSDYGSYDPFENAVDDSSLDKVHDWWKSDPTFVFMNWTVDDISNIPRDILLDNLWTAEKIDLTAQAKTRMWKTLRSTIKLKSISVEMLRALRSLIYFIPEKDLFELDMTNWKIVRYVGSLPGFSRRKLGVLSYAMQKVWGDEVMFTSRAINNFGNLICGFPSRKLATIPPKTFLKLKGSLFAHCYGCTPRQMRQLLNVAMEPIAYGPVDIWDDRIVKQLGLLITQMTGEELQHIRLRAMKGIKAAVLTQFTNKQLESFLDEQVLRMTPASIGIHRWRIGLKSSDAGTNGETWMVMLVVCLPFSLWGKVVD